MRTHHILRRRAGTVVLTLLALALQVGSLLARPKYVEPAHPFSSLFKGPIHAYRARGATPVPLITWGGDIATIYANGGRVTQPGSIFAKKGLKIELQRQDNFVQQVAAYRAGKTPYLRGTLGMINLASEALSADEKARPVVIYQLTWSTGGDALVARGDIKKARDLKGKTIALQQYGPHMAYLDTILRDAGLTWSDVRIRWLPELTIPSYDTHGQAVDPASAMREDKSIDAAMVIIPDALALTSGGTVGTGAEDSVKGARILLSTRTANRVIADVYAVRADYLAAHRDEVQKFVHGLLLAQEALADLVKNKRGRQAEYQQLLSKAADILLDSPQATADAEGLLGDCTYVGYAGNQRFFNDPRELRSFARLSKAIQETLVREKFLTRRVELEHAGWDYEALRKGLTQVAVVDKPKFDRKKVERALAKRPAATTAENVLFEFEVTFAPNQTEFPIEKYKDAFERAVELASTYGGALLQIVGHSDPMKYLRAAKKGASQAVLNRLRQSGKNLSLSRANRVREQLIEFAKERGLTIDPSQFIVSGAGIDNPKHPRPRSETEWRQNMRVQFQVINVEAELDTFTPLD